MPQPAEVVCVGCACVDILLKNVDTAALLRGNTKVDGVTVAPGGDALNQSIVLAHLGHTSALCSLAGRDIYGDVIRLAAGQNGVDVRGLRISETTPTSVSVVCILPNGERHLITHGGGTVQRLALADIDLSLIGSGTRVLSLGSIGGSERLIGDDLIALFLHAKRNGALIVADAVADQGKETLSHISGALPYIDYFLPSLEEAICFSGQEDPEECVNFFLGLGIQNVVLKMGRQGALANLDGSLLQTPALRTRTVDTTGAGDNFVAGFISGILAGQTPKEALAFATATAAVSVTSIGATAGVNNRQQVEALLFP